MSTLRPYRFPFAKYPAVRLALLLILGISLAVWFPFNAWWWGAGLGIIMLGWAASEYIFERNLQPRFSYLAVGLYLLGVISFGAFWHALRDRQTQPASARLLESYTWQSIQVKGTVQNINQTSTGKYQLDVSAQRTIVEDSLTWREPYKLRAIYDTTKATLPETMELGSTIQFTATVYPLEGKRNPHDFDYKQYLASQSIYSQVGITNLKSINPQTQWWHWSWWRQGALNLIEKNFDPQTAPLAKALLLGYKNELPRGEKMAFSRAGLSHIMAVSGLHVGFIIAPFWLLIPLFWSFKWGRQIGLAIFCGLVFFYAGLTGFSTSVMRASLTGGLLTYGRLFHKPRDSKNLTAVAAIIILLIHPNQLFAIGFQLSFTAVYIILLVLPVLQRYLPQRIRHRWYGVPVMIMLVSFVVQLGLYPLLSYYFGEFSLVGPLANAVIVPWLAVMVPYALLLLVVSAFFPFAGFWLNAPCRWFLVLVHRVVNTAVSWDWSWIQRAPPGPLIFLIWLAAILYIASLPYPKRRWKALILMLLILTIQQGDVLYRKLQPPRLTVTMLDVGQGDATFVSTPGGKHFLIDTGRWTPGYNSAKYVILPHLKALGIHKLDAVFLSHPHADHIGGLPELIKNIKIDTIYNSGRQYDSNLYRRYHRLARQKGIPVKSLHAGMKVRPDPSVPIFIYGPSAQNHDSDVNEHSLVMELMYGKTQFLFVGDAGADEETLLLRHYPKLLDTDFLKVGHHGSRTSSSTPFLQDITPRYATVSLGLHNRFHHPNGKAIHRLEATHAHLYFTSLRGALKFQSDGTKIWYQPWR